MVGPWTLDPCILVRIQARQPVRKSQDFRLAASRLGGQIERDFPTERQFSIL